MKKILKNKGVVIALCALLVISLSVIIAISVRNDSAKGPEPDSTPTTENSTTDTSVTEESTEKVDTETSTTTTTTESTTKPETTTKKPNKTETTTKKPVTTTKPSKSEEEENRDIMYAMHGGKAGYEAHLKEVANYKCDTCGKHNCPSLEYGTDLLGNPDWPGIHSEKCPAIINETAKCPHCGKTLVEDNRWQTEPDKYCRGTCHISFG